MKSHSRVGLMISTCAMLEGELAYLNWQLVAFDWAEKNPATTGDARQLALNAERAKKKWGKNTPLAERIDEITKAFDAQSVRARAGEDPKVAELCERWPRIHGQTKPLAQKRNDICHSSLGLRAGKLEREFGKLWGDTFPTSEAEENALIKGLSDLFIEVSELTTSLGFLLPFADGNLQISATAS